MTDGDKSIGRCLLLTPLGLAVFATVWGHVNGDTGTTWMWWKVYLFGESPWWTLVFCLSCIGIGAGAVAILLGLAWKKKNSSKPQENTNDR